MSNAPERRVLIVDDDGLLAHLISARLQMLCDAVEIASTMRDARDALQTAQFALVLLDLSLPDSLPKMTLKAIHQLRTLGASVIAIITGDVVGDELERTCIMAGANYVLSKNDNYFIDRVQVLLGVSVAANLEN